MIYFDMDDAYLSKVSDNLGNVIKRHYKTLDVQNSCSGDRNPLLRYNVNIRYCKNSTALLYRRPSLQSRLQDGKNLQLCFINEKLIEIENNHIDDAVVSLPMIPSTKYMLNNSDTNSLPVFSEESNTGLPVDLGSYYHTDEINVLNNVKNIYDNNNNSNNLNYCVQAMENQRNTNKLNHLNTSWDTTRWSSELCKDVPATLKKVYLDTRQKMELQHRPRSDSPITCTIKSSLKKIGFEDERNYEGHRRMNRHMLTKMSSNQLQTIIDDLHMHVEYLNEQLMEMLIAKDELHMRRDSLLVDIEDLTAYLDAKHVYKKNSCTKF